MSVKLLSDFQLYTLSLDQFLPDAQKRIIQGEMTIRNIEQGAIESFQSDLDQWDIGEPGRPFYIVEYILILLTSHLLGLHLIFQTILYHKRKFKSWEHYWKVIVFGNLMWIGVLILGSLFWYLSVNSMETIIP